MKDLKFRVYDKTEQTFIYFTLNDAVCQDAGFDKTRQKLIEHTDTSEDEQFTGLKDKLGKEIYEGDIVKFIGINERKDTVGIVENYDYIRPVGKRSFYESCGECGQDIQKFSWDKLEVIGNIHENKEIKKGN